MAVFVNLVGSKVTRTFNGWRAEAIYHVNQLLASAGAQRLVDATNHPELPSIGQEFGEGGTGNTVLPGVYCTEKITEGLAPDSCRVTCIFEQNDGFGGGTIEVGATLQPIKINKDINGAPIQVQYPEAATSGNYEGISTTQIGEVEALEPVLTVRYTLLEEYPQNIPGVGFAWASPADKAKFFTGTVNRFGVFGDPPRTWLCTHIEGSSQNPLANPSQWNTTYEFVRKAKIDREMFDNCVMMGGNIFDCLVVHTIEGGWDATVAWTDPRTGRQPPVYTGDSPLVDGVGVQDYRIWLAMDWSGLGI